MKMAIAVETHKHPDNRGDYKVWYLLLNKNKEVIKLDVVSREQLIKDLMHNYRKFGKSNWRAFLKTQSESTPIDLTDFIAQNIHENTHFGNLPNLCEFQDLLDRLKMGMEIRAIA